MQLKEGEVVPKRKKQAHQAKASHIVKRGLKVEGEESGEGGWKDGKALERKIKKTQRQMRRPLNKKEGQRKEKRMEKYDVINADIAISIKGLERRIVHGKARSSRKGNRRRSKKKIKREGRGA